MKQHAALGTIFRIVSVIKKLHIYFTLSQGSLKFRKPICAFMYWTYKSNFIDLSNTSRDTVSLKEFEKNLFLNKSGNWLFVKEIFECKNLSTFCHLEKNKKR